MLAAQANADMVDSKFMPPGEPSSYPHGEAALLLVESLIHFLIERSVMTCVEAIDVVQIASDAHTEISLDRGEGPGLKATATGLLASIAASLAIDIR